MRGSEWKDFTPDLQGWHSSVCSGGASRGPRAWKRCATATRLEFSRTAPACTRPGLRGAAHPPLHLPVHSLRAQHSLHSLHIAPVSPPRSPPRSLKRPAPARCAAPRPMLPCPALLPPPHTQKVRFVVLDEADQMLNVGFEKVGRGGAGRQARVATCPSIGPRTAPALRHTLLPSPPSPQDVETILNNVPAERQTMLFSGGCAGGWGTCVRGGTGRGDLPAALGPHDPRLRRPPFPPPFSQPPSPSGSRSWCAPT